MRRRAIESLEILRKPIVTEKSVSMQDSGKYTFEVSPEATKHQIKIAVQEAFDVTVLHVNTMTVKSKRKRFGPRIVSHRPWKKAIVRLAPGNTITIFEGV